jgi:hypothetical protein
VRKLIISLFWSSGIMKLKDEVVNAVIGFVIRL